MRSLFILPLRPAEPFRFLDVKVLRCATDRSNFRWSVREKDGSVIQTAHRAYPTEAEAFRAGNAAARAIRKQVRVPAAAPTGTSRASNIAS